VLISGAAYEHTRGRIDADFVDLGEKALKNIERPIRVYSLQVGAPPQAKVGTDPQATENPLEPKRRSVLLSLIAGIAALIVIVGGAWYFLAGNRTAPVAATTPAHLSLVVLPFANLSGDPAQDYFADGVTENLTTDLRAHSG
jgi:adenylate cyclase